MKKIDTRKAEDDLAEIEFKIENHRVEISNLESQAGALRTFLRVAVQYEAADIPEVSVAVDVEKDEPVVDQPAATATKKKRQMGRAPFLTRDDAKPQTKVALALVRQFIPGETLTIKDAEVRIRGVIHHPTNISVAHHLSNFLTREAISCNGVLERLGRGQYRLRHDAGSRVNM